MNNVNIKNNLITLGLLGALWLGGAAFWYWADSVQSDLKEVITLSVGGSEATQQAKLQAMRKEVRDTASQRKQLHERMLTEEQVPQFLNRLETLGGSEMSVFIRAIDVNTGDGVLKTSIAFSGIFEDVKALVDSIDDLGYISYIDSFEVRTGRANTGGKVWDASMRIALPLIVESEE